MKAKQPTMRGLTVFWCGGLLAGGLVMATGSGCTSAPVTGRSSLDLVDDKVVVAKSAEAFEEMKRTNRISRNRDYNDRLQRVGTRVADAIGFWVMPLADWEFVVFDASGEVNALAMPGGKVAVFSGAFSVATTDDQLAVIIAHEIAHVTQRHVHERLSQQLLAEAGGGVLSVVAGVAGGSLTQLAVTSAYQNKSGTIGLSLDRKRESEADQVGLIFMARAGYNPRAAIELWEKMDQIMGGKSAPPEWLSTHPSHENRIAQLYGWMEAAEAEYKKHKVEQP